MAEEKQGQGTNPPPQEQPNEPLPRSHNQLLGTNNPPKTSWPELVGVTAEEAERKIKEEKAGVEIQVVPPDSVVTADFKPQRVRLYVDESNKVIRTPGTGMAAGIYSGLTYGLKEAGGAHDWKNSVVAGVITGATLALTLEDSIDEQVVQYAIGAALSTAVNLLTGIF